MTDKRIRRGPVFFSLGFRPFFLAGGLQAAVMVALWVPWYLGFVHLPSALPPVAWHAHELLFGYVPAVVAGFLLTAVPNWTGRKPVTGLPLAGLLALWLLGRAAVAVSAGLSPLLVAAAALAFPVALVAVVAREIVAAGNWRNLKVLGGLGMLTLAQAWFHAEVARYGTAVHSDRLAVAATLTLIMIVAGRIVPNFTANWIRKNNPGAEPAGFGRLDMAAMVVAVAALALWVLQPAPAIEAHPAVTGAALIAAGLLQFARQCRWVPQRTLAEPLVAVLHLAFLFVPVGFLLAGRAVLTGEAMAGATHAWTVGAIGLMTLAVMTRATRGHTGRSLTAPPTTVAIYVAILIAALARLVAAEAPQWTMVALPVAGLAWTAAFLGFSIVYGAMMVRRRADGP